MQKSQKDDITQQHIDI